MRKILEIENLSFGYDNSKVIENINLNIYRNDFVGIIGNNGSGKSTFLKILIGELKDYVGEMKIFDQNHKRFKDWKKIGYVPQVDRVNSVAFPISVKEMVLLNLYQDFNIFNRPSKRHFKEVDTVLEMFGIKNFANKNFNELSGGQKQRVMIAKAMVHKPEVLIFDEPTVGIDEDSKKEFFSVLKHLNKDHDITIIMVTHELEIADRYFTRKFILKNKEMREI